MVAVEGLGLALVCVAVVTYVVSIITVIVRCWVRLKLMKFFGWDDVLMIVALIFETQFFVCATGAAVNGSAKRFAELAADETERSLLFWYIGQVGYVLTAAFVKVSISIFLLRITINRVHSWILHGVITVTLVVGIILLFIVLFQCRPVSYFWDRSSSDGECLGTSFVIGIVYFYHVTSAICDFTIGVLPITIVWNMSFDRKTKAAIVCIMGMGCIASAAVVARMPYIEGYRKTDFLYHTVGIVICSHLEVALGVTAGSLATLRPLLRYLRQRRTASGPPRSESTPTISPDRDNDNDNGGHYKREHNLLYILSASRLQGNTRRNSLYVGDALDAEVAGDDVPLDEQSAAMYARASRNTSDADVSRTLPPGSSDGSHMMDTRSTSEHNAV